MASVAFPNLAKKFVTSDGTTYGYVYAPARNSKPTFFFIHGYPATSYEWKHQIKYLSEAGFGALAPDTLGYGDTDKPTELSSYKLKRLASHFTQIMDNESLDKVIGVGHDWGSMLLSGTVSYHPGRFSKIAWMAVGHVPPQRPFPIDTYNALTLKQLGYPVFGYWYFFNSPDAATIIRKNLDSHHSLLYPKDPQLWVTDFAPIDGLRTWLTEGCIAPRPDWITEEEKQAWIKIFQHDHTGPLNYYKATLRGIQQVDKDEFSPEQQRLKVPVLLIGCPDDKVCLSDMQKATTSSFCDAGFKYVEVPSGHWPQLEAKDKINELLENFAKEG